MTYFYAIEHNFMSRKNGKIAHASILRFTDEAEMHRQVAKMVCRGRDAEECTEVEVQRVIEARRARPEIFLADPYWIQDRRLDGSPLPWEYLTCFV